MIGISGDPVRNQKLFKKTHGLNFPLLADEKGEVARKFGVPVRKGGTLELEVAGKREKLTRGVTEARWTFVIGKDGKIAYRNTKVRPAKDSKQVLAVIEKLAR